MAGSRNARNKRSFPFVLPLLLMLLSTTAIFSCVSAQELGGDSEDNPSIESVKLLDRRSKVVLRTSQNDDTDDDVDSKSKLTDIAGYSEFGLGLLDAFFASLSIIIVSEIGDETFIIAALMAMRHPKSIVLSGALTALVVMTVLSTALGRIVPNLISRKHTNNAATVLYAFFGLRLLYIAWRSDSKGSQKKEMEEVEEKLEAGQGKTAFRRFFSRFCTPIFLEVFKILFC
ncbi:unnamed protein product [Victoria cruziana]